MPLDLYAGDVHLSINHSEEFLFQLASENPKRYPELTQLWAAFYDDPLLTSEQSGLLVHELIELGESYGDDNAFLLHCVNRFLPFFSKAYRRSLNVRCSSD